MENNCRRTATTVSMLNYHFVFCPRYRRKIFLIPGVEDRFKELVALKCKELDISIIAMECDKDHVHLFLNCLPDVSPTQIMQWIKGSTSKLLLDAGANVHACNDYALRRAAGNGHLAIVKLLLNAGADVHACCNFTLRWAAENGYTQIVNLLKAYA